VRTAVGRIARVLLVVAGLGVLLSASVAVVPASTCRSEVSGGVLPSWARVGFSEPRPRAAHVIGEHGRIAAILFGSQLHSPPSPDVNNKILWVSRTGAEGPLRIRATLAGSGERAAREIADGPGPSSVDLPAPGCWQVALQWGPGPDQRDTLALVYSHP
jgi:hypothetical protein